MSDVEKLVEALEWAKTAVLAIITLETTLGTGRNHAKLVEGYDLINNALEANRKAEAMGGWRPIEEAPRDGTVVLLYCASGISQGAFLDAVDDTGKDIGKHWFLGLNMGMATAFDCTHFMPLPAAPKGVG